MRGTRTGERWWLALIIVLAATSAFGQELRWGEAGDESVFLPDGRPLPPLPVYLEGAWTRDDFRVILWRADLAVKGDTFEGRVSVGEFEQFAPLTVQGTRKGNIVEFSVRLNENEVSYFAGHVAGTSIVGVIETPDGRGVDWAGTWVGDSVISEGSTNPTE